MPYSNSRHSFQTRQPRLSAFPMTNKKDSFDAFTPGNVSTRLHAITPLAGAELEKVVVADDFLACAICQWHHCELDAALNAVNVLRMSSAVHDHPPAHGSAVSRREENIRRASAIYMFSSLCFYYPLPFRNLIAP